jgi:hypothetical protein
MVISKSRRAGFFAELTTTLRHIKKVREDNKSILVEWGSGNSLYYNQNHGENVWEYYFEKVDLVDNSGIDYVLDNYIPIHPFDGINNRETFNKLYFDNVKLNETTTKIINENIKLVDKKTLGLHIRKTDKLLGTSFNEPMSIPVDDVEVFNLIDPKLDNNYENIFLSTDCQETYKNFLNRYGNKIINVDRLRGSGVNAIHTSGIGDGYIKGLESLIDSYILSECGFLIRSTSNLSSFSMFMNLDLECININEIYRGDIREHEFNIYSKI